MSAPVSNPEDYADWPSLEDLWRAIGKDREWVAKRLREMNVRPVLIRLPSRYHNRLLEVYPPETVSSLEALRNADAAVPPIGQNVTLGGLQRETGKSRSWIEAFVRDRKFEPERRRLPDGKIADTFSPFVLGEARAEIARQEEEKAPRSWQTRRQLAKALGIDEDTVESWLSALGIEGRLLRKPDTGRLLLHYHPEAARLLELIRDSVPPAGEMLSVDDIAKRLGMTVSWVRWHLRPWRMHAQERRKNGRKVLVYPSRIAERLAEQEDIAVPAAPLWRLLQKAHYQQGISWEQLTRLSGLGRSVEHIGRDTLIPRSEARMVLEGLLAASKSRRRPP